MGWGGLGFWVGGGGDVPPLGLGVESGFLRVEWDLLHLTPSEASFIVEFVRCGWRGPHNPANPAASAKLGRNSELSSGSLGSSSSRPGRS